MAGGVSLVCKRSCWGRMSCCRLGGYRLCILCKCGSIPGCFGVFLCFAAVLFALCSGWGLMSVCGLLGVL
jgi:hypothetical protein